MNIYPYVYRLDHPVTGEFYIGFRSANKVPAEQDLGHKYFTSSKTVKPRFNEFVYHVIAEFFDKESAYEFEQKIIFDNIKDKKLLNKRCHHGCEVKFISPNESRIKTGTHNFLTNNPSTSKVGHHRIGTQHSEETKNKIRLSSIGKVMSQHAKDKMSKAKSKNIKVYDQTGHLIFDVQGNFTVFCNLNNLPIDVFINSYRNNGSPIYQDSNPKKKKFLKYKGWYAIASRS